jgi:hypothetical protein
MMPCNQRCNQGRDCQCGDRSVDKEALVVAMLLLIFTVLMVFGLYKIIIEPVSKGQDCQIEVQFQDSKATYIGKTV